MRNSLVKFSIKRMVDLMGNKKWWLMDSTTRVQYAGHAPATFADDANLNAGANEYATFISGIVQERCRQDGYIRRITVRIYNNGFPSADNRIKFKIFRPNGALFDFVAQTGWYVPTAIGNQVFDLVDPLPCRPGDILGFTVPGDTVPPEAPLRTGCKTAVGTGTIRYAWGTGEAGDIVATHAFGSSVNNLALCIEGSGASPYLAITGDSIAAGYNLWQGHYDTGPAGTLTSYLLYHLRQMVAPTSFEWQNFGNGAETFAWVAATGMPAALASGAKVILIHCGVNDLNNNRTWAQVEADLNTIKALFDASATAEKLLINEILPWNNGSDAKAAELRTWNGNLATWCTANGATLVNCHDAMGQVRVSTGELDNLITAYNADGVHLTNAGQAALAGLVRRDLKG